MSKVKKLPFVLTEDQVEILFRQIEDYRSLLMFQTMYYCALRSSELLGLQRQDITIMDGPTSQLKIVGERYYKNEVGAKVKVGAKGKWERIVPIPTPLAKRLLRFNPVPKQIHTLKDTTFIFASRKHPKRPVHRTTIFRALERKMEEHFGGEVAKRTHPHTLRHSCATHFYKRTKDIVALQRFLGHRDLKTTLIYTHLCVEDVEEQYAAFTKGRKLRATAGKVIQ